MKKYFLELIGTFINGFCRNWIYNFNDMSGLLTHLGLVYLLVYCNGCDLFYWTFSGATLNPSYNWIVDFRKI